MYSSNDTAQTWLWSSPRRWRFWARIDPNQSNTYSQLVTVVNYGIGQTRTGGKPLTAMGHCVGYYVSDARKNASYMYTYTGYMTIGCKEIGRASCRERV